MGIKIDFIVIDYVQLLKAVQNQISVLSAKKYRTSSEQISLQRLFNEQQKILQCGKIVPTVSGQNSQGITYVKIFNSFKRSNRIVCFNKCI